MSTQYSKAQSLKIVLRSELHIHVPLFFFFLTMPVETNFIDKKETTAQERKRQCLTKPAVKCTKQYMT